MVSDQLSSQNNTGSGGMLSPEMLDSIVNLVELSNSELTLSSGGESLPVTDLLLDALLDLLADRRPDLLVSSQRIGLMCAGIASELNWTRKWTNNLICAGLLHELGTLTESSPREYWNTIGTPEERVTRNVAIDFLAATHGDSDLLDILALSHNFRFRKNVDEETPRYVVQGAAALSAVRFFETGRIFPDNPRQAPELLAALRNIYKASDEEIEVIDALEAWLQKETALNVDPAIFLPSTMSNDPETAEIVRETFQEILDTFRILQARFDSYFMLDGTGRFQIWSSKSERFLGRSVRAMRNTHWSNEIVKYCNEEGFPFSDAQTPLYQTLTTGKPARLHLCMQDINDRLFEVEVNAIPVIGRDQLMQAILEFHNRLKPVEEPPQDIQQTAEKVAGLASELLKQFEDDPEQHPLPNVSFEKIDRFEEQLRSGAVLEPSEEPEYSDSSIFSEDKPEVYTSLDQNEVEPSDVLSAIHTSENAEQSSLDTVPEEQTDEEPDYVLSQDSTDQASDGGDSGVLEDPLSGIDGIISKEFLPGEDDSDLAVKDSTIILKSPLGGEPSDVFADQEFLDLPPAGVADQEEFPGAEPETEQPEPESSLPAPPEEPVVEEAAEPAVAEEQVSEVEELEESAADEERHSVEETVEAVSEEPVVELQPAEEQPSDEVPIEEAAQPATDDKQPTEQPASAAEALERRLESVTGKRQPAEPAPVVTETESVAPELSEPVVEETSSEAPAAEEPSVEHSPVDEAPVEEPSPSESEPVNEKQSSCPTPLVIPEVQEFLRPEEEEPAPVPQTQSDTPAPAAPTPAPAPAVAAQSHEQEQVGHLEWEEYVKAVMDDSSPLHEPIGVLLLEIDSIDSVTKEFGHQIVEDLMSEFERRLAGLCTARELACRYGSAQFAIGCPGLDLKSAYKRGDKVRQLFEKIRFDVMPIKKLTVSVGVTVAEPRDSFDTLIHRTEFALSRAQKIGRNCCVALDSEEVLNEKRKERDEEGSRVMVNDFVLTAEFEAMIASDMIVYKLGGFLYDLGAKLIKVDRKHVEMRVGAKRLLPYWGKNPDSQPVLVDLQLGENWDQKKTSKRAVSNTTIQVRIRPDGWIKDKKVFKERADQVLRALKGYFAAK